MIASCSGGPPHRIEDKLVVRVSGGALALLPWGLRELEKVMPLQRRAAPPREDIACNASPKVWHRVRHGLSLAAAVVLLPVDGRLSNGDGSFDGAADGGTVDASELWLLERRSRREALLALPSRRSQLVPPSAAKS